MPLFTETANGFLLSADQITYTLEWINGTMKVTGGDVCYYLFETARGLEQVSCQMTNLTLLIGN